MGAWREVGLGLALVGGGLLISLWRPLPFVFAAAVILVITAVFVWRGRGPGHGGAQPGAHAVRRAHPRRVATAAAPAAGAAGRWPPTRCGRRR